MLQDAQSVRHAVATGATIGFAIPPQDGQFKVVRFSLSGALQAAGSRRRQEAIRRVESNKPADVVM